jgi:cytochrome b
MKRIKVWDLPVRLFHWALVVLVVTAFVTQQIGGNAMQWHFRAGYATLTLILFRIVWGFVGPRYARFSDFLRGPSAILAHLRGRSEQTTAGHSPLGSLSVLAMLLVLLFQAMAGLFANDDIASEGPLVKFISKELSDQTTWLHKDIGATLIYLLVGLHLAAIAWYLLRKKQNLIVPMVTGDKTLDASVPDAHDGWRVRLLAAALLAVCAGAVYLVVNLQPSP